MACSCNNIQQECTGGCGSREGNFCNYNWQCRGGGTKEGKKAKPSDPAPPKQGYPKGLPDDDYNSPRMQIDYSDHTTFCPHGTYLLDGGRYCQSITHGPSGDITGLYLRSQVTDGPKYIKAKLVTRHFQGDIETLSRLIVNMKSSYHHQQVIYQSVYDGVSNVINDFILGLSSSLPTCNRCLNDNTEGYCVIDVCITNLFMRDNKTINCDIKLRY